MLTHGGRSLFAAQGLMHCYRDGDGGQGLGIEAGWISGTGRLRHRWCSAVEAKKHGDEKRHHGEKEEHQAHPKNGELYSNVE
jgi:hypothetical protein